MATSAAKFLFDEDFATGEKPTITIVEHERRRKDTEAVAYRNGFEAAQAQGVAEAEKRLAAAITQIGEVLERLSRGLQGVEVRLEVEAVEVAVAVARKLAPALIDAQPFAEIQALAVGVLPPIGGDTAHRNPRERGDARRRPAKARCARSCAWL